MFNYISRDPIDCLVTNTDQSAIPITLVTADSFENWFNILAEHQQNWVKTNNFKARKGTTLVFSSADGTLESVAAGTGDGEMTPWDYAKIVTSLPDANYRFANASDKNEIRKAAFGWAMTHYNFDRYRKNTHPKKARLVLGVASDLDHISQMVRATTLTRDLVNTPTCDMGPSELEDVSRALTREFNAEISVVTGDELLDSGYDTIHTVGRAAEKAPRLIDITWGDPSAKKLTLVGKGVCFDTGGLDIKPSNAMLTMKKDMGGAAHVLGLAQMIMESELDVRLRVLIPAVENNISGNAFRPGDIIKSYKGTTIEVGNTDAEGRLVLCDALALASEEKPDLIIDFATLTGAARVALGTDVVPYFTDNDELSADLLDFASREDDPLWPLPLYKPYKKLLSSTIADTNNVGSTGFGGAITAALFLKDFVDEDIPYIHFDVYAWNSSARPGRPKGGEAMGLRAVYGLLADKFSD